MTAPWKKDVLDRLGQYEALRRADENIPLLLKKDPTVGWWDKWVLRRRLRQVRLELTQLDRALELLNPQERLVVQMLCINPQKGNLSRLCSLLQCEQATVYRRRKAALGQLSAALYGGQ